MAAVAERRLVFMGTPPFAAEVLRRLASWEQGRIVAVYTQPDRPARRGRRLTESAVKTLAQHLHLPVCQPETLRDGSACQYLRDLRPDFLLVAAYGMLLPENVLSIPTFPPLNVHASLLPRYRGAAPVQRAIMDQDAEHGVSGVSIMQMVRALDAGPVYLQKTLPLGDHVADSYLEALAPLGAEALLEVMEDMLAGRAVAQPQDEEAATYAQKLEKKDGYITFDRPAERVDAQIRAVTSWPGAQCTLHIDALEKDIPVLLLPGRRGSSCSLPPGTLAVKERGLQIACTDFWYELGRLKPQGRKLMEIRDFVNGYIRELPEGVCGHAE